MSSNYYTVGGITMPEMRISASTKYFTSVDVPGAIMELARQGVCGQVSEKKTLRGKVWALKIAGVWHINYDAEVKNSVMPGHPNPLKPWRVENVLSPFARRPVW